MGIYNLLFRLSGVDASRTPEKLILPPRFLITLFLNPSGWVPMTKKKEAELQPIARSPAWVDLILGKESKFFSVLRTFLRALLMSLSKVVSARL